MVSGPPRQRARYGLAEAGIFGEDIGTLGDPFGKELTLFNLEDVFDQGNGKIQAKFIRSFGAFQTPMGVETMSEEVIVCNMNNGTVEFTDFDGNEQLKLPTPGRGPNKFDDPFAATILLDCRILVGDKRGIHIYSGQGEFEKSVQPPQMKHGGKLYGVLPVRQNGGNVVLVVDEGSKVQFVTYDSQMTRVVKTVSVNFDDDSERHCVRFATALGNTVLLSDMSRANPGIWICDLNGQIRSKIGSQFSDEQGEFIQAAGVCFDNKGNFLAMCSRTSRITAFRADGSLMCELQFPEGAIERPSDLSINDDGKMAVVSIKGQCFLFDLLPGDPEQSWPTRGPKPRGGYSMRGGRGRGRGRGRGNFRGGRGGSRPFRARY